MKTLRKRKQTRRKTKRQTAGVRKNLSPNEKKNLRAVLLYERSPQKTKILSENTLTIGERIHKLIDKQIPLNESMIVYRGQHNHQILPELGWFSTSMRDDVARSYSSKFLFKIYLQPGVKILDMYAYYNKYGIQDPVKELNELQENYFQHNKDFTNNDYTQFQEVLVEGGGSFWQDSEKTTEGFRFIGKVNPMSPSLEEENMKGNEEHMVSVYETYYFPKSR